MHVLLSFCKRRFVESVRDLLVVCRPTGFLFLLFNLLIYLSWQAMYSRTCWPPSEPRASSPRAPTSSASSAPARSSRCACSRYELIEIGILSGDGHWWLCRCWLLLIWSVLLLPVVVAVVVHRCGAETRTHNEDTTQAKKQVPVLSCVAVTAGLVLFPSVPLNPSGKNDLNLTPRQQLANHVTYFTAVGMI